jgi:hypothetical protein
VAAYAGEWPVIDLDLHKSDEPLTVAQRLTADSPKLASPRIATMRDSLLRRGGFQERFAPSTIEHDLIGLLGRPPTAPSKRWVPTKLAREAMKGEHQSVAFGLAQIGQTPVVLYAMNWDFFAGSFGVVEFQMASHLTLRRNAPLVAIYCSSGVRQHVSFAS